MISLDAYPFVFTCNILWNEMDAFGIVNNTVFFKYFESARLEYYNSLHLDILAYGKEGMGPVLASTSCKYLVPLTYPDKISTGVKVTDITEKRLIFEHSIFSQDGYCAAIGRADMAFMNYKSREVVSVPEEMVWAINILQKTSF